LDTWEGRENLENAKEAVEEFEKEYRRDMEDVVTPYKRLGKISDILHLNNKNNQLER